MYQWSKRKRYREEERENGKGNERLATREGERERKKDRGREREIGERKQRDYPFRLGSSGISQEFLARNILRGDGGAAVISYSPRRGMACTAIYFIMSLSLMALALTRL